MHYPKIILASESIARKQILTSILGYPFITHPTHIDESLLSKEDAPKATLRLAMAKLKAAALDERFLNHFIISADTMVVVQNKILNKTDDVSFARQSLKLLSGKRHTILTAVCIQNPFGEMREKLVESKVKFKPLSDQEIDLYLQSNDWHDRAGCYSLYGVAQKFIISIIGSPSAVMGLPAYETMNLLKGLGLK
jgi:septum formation protein